MTRLTTKLALWLNSLDMGVPVPLIGMASAFWLGGKEPQFILFQLGCSFESLKKKKKIHGYVNLMMFLDCLFQ